MRAKVFGQFDIIDFIFRMYPNIYFNYILKLILYAYASIYSYIVNFIPLFLYFLFENKNSVVLTEGPEFFFQI